MTRRGDLPLHHPDETLAAEEMLGDRRAAAAAGPWRPCWGGSGKRRAPTDLGTGYFAAGLAPAAGVFAAAGVTPSSASVGTLGRWAERFFAATP